MKLYIAGVTGTSFIVKRCEKEKILSDVYLLESYYYIKSREWFKPYIPRIGSFMLDSGAFTFMQNKKMGVDWERYVENYAEYIIQNDIELFVEIDIDVIVGLERVEKLRERLENLVGRKSIPVWHRNRGKQYYFDMCQEYNYVALGGLVSGEITKTDVKYFPWFVEQAHKYNTKVHCLGFTAPKSLKKYSFDSVDSSNWNTVRYHYQDVFNSELGVLDQVDKGGKRVKKDCRDEYQWSQFMEWVKFQRYIERYSNSKRGN